jgi:tRNA pseudouridine55 synthase
VAASVRGRSFADGALVIDKPAGPTSHDIVAAVRRMSGGKVGHTGTLDPLATGVLPLLVGRATRLAQFLGDAHKVYEAGIRFGWATDTGDAAGKPLGSETDVQPRPEHLAAALDRFRGTFDQTPPAYSAKRVGGRRSYDLARADRALELEAVPVTVHALDLVRLDASVAILRIVCSAGFYVRSLAHDLGVAIGCGAHLTSLRRLASGRFTLDHAIGLGQALTDHEAALAAVIPMADILPDLPALHITASDVERVRRGLDLAASETGNPLVARGGTRVRLLAPDGTLTAVATRVEGTGALHPAVVLG